MAKTKPATPDRVALQWLLATGVCACAPLAFHLPLWVTLAFVGSVVWRYLIERHHVYRPGRWVCYALVALLLMVVFREFGTVFGRDSGMALLTVLLGFKLLELRSQRDAMFTLFLFYVALTGGFLFGQTLPAAVWAVIAIAVSLVTLMRLQQQLPARAALRLSAELLLKAVPLLLILYLFFPRLEGALWGLPTDAYAGVTGMPEEVSPGTIRSLSESSEIAFRVDFIGSAPPPARQLYWRGLVLWQTDGKSWKREAPAIGAERIHPFDAPVQYRVTLEPNNKRWLFALDLPTTTPDDARMRPGLTLVRTEPVDERISYTLSSHTRYTTGALTATERTAALALPPVSARVRAFIDELRAQQRDPMAIVNAVLAYFRQENFVYTLTPPLLGDDPVDQFLFETRRGFCEHYATAFATLMRAAGIPARVVIGYQGGELNPSGNYLIVRQSDAHAWTEVWLEDRGWARVDPTSAIAPERIELGLEAIRRLEAQGLVPGAVGADLLARAMDLPWLERSVHQLRLYWDYTNIAWYRWVVDYRKPRQENLLHTLGFETIEWSQVLVVLGAACALVLIGYVVWARRSAPPDPAQRQYSRFCRKLARIGFRRAAHEGPLAFADRVRSQRPELAPDIGIITERYLDLRYGPNASNDTLRALARAVGDFKPR